MVGLRMRLPGLHSKPALLELNRADADQHLMQWTLVFPKHLGHVINQIPAADCRFFIQASHTIEAAKWIAPKKLRAVLS